MKIIKCISLDKKIVEDIKKRQKKYSFNFSEWVGTKYQEQFMSIDSKQKEIEKLNKKITKLREDIKFTKKYEDIARKILNTTEKRFLLNVPIMLNSGSTIEGLCETFNRLNQKDFSIEEFKKVVEAVKNVTYKKK